jgi:uncharacterized membrane protein YdfJ with MMPL/SSD domain
MHTLMRRIDALVQNHLVLIACTWVAILAVATPLAIHQSDHLTASGFSVPGSQSARVDAVLSREFPEADRAVIAVLLWPGKGATPDALIAGIGRVVQASRHLAGAELTKQVRELAPFAAELGEPVGMPLKVTVSEDQARNIVRTLRSRLDVGRPTSDGVEVHLLGESALWAGLEETAKKQLASAETIGAPILLVVLLVIFGSLWAALVPLTMGAVALVVTGGIIYCLSLVVPLSLFTMDAASMLGIGIAIDYSLIVLLRVRQELASRNLAGAREIALATSGSAVMFSGITVIAALGGVLLVPIGALRSMALGAALIVLVSVLASITLLPALITVLGSRRIGRSIFTTRSWPPWPQRKDRTPAWERWVTAVTRRPVFAIVGVGSVLLALCLPALSMRTDTGVLQQLDPKNETRVGFTEASQLAGPGVLGPASVVLHASRSVSAESLNHSVEQLRRIAERLPNVHRLGPTETSRNRTYATFTVVPTLPPESSGAEHLVERLRQSLPRALVGTRISVAVGGASATQLDEVRKIATSMWKILLAVLAISLIPMMVLLRSVVLPIKAIAMNLLSVGTAYGILVMVFQWGWLDSLFDYHSPGHVDTLVPPLLLAIVFGLSTDYEMFLLTRIRERWLASGDSRRAVNEGLAASARTITGAAFIIVCVFAVFVGTGIPIIKEIGLGAAVAIGVDATLIRLALVPATMTLLGDRSWWLPRGMQRLLPSQVVVDQGARDLLAGDLSRIA